MSLARPLSMAGQRSRHTAPGERPASSIGRRFRTRALAGSESQAPSTAMHTPAPFPTRRGAGRARALCSPCSRTCSLVPCAAGTCSPRLSRATRAEHTHPTHEPGDHPTVWRPRTCCHLARFRHGFPLSCVSLDSLFSDTHASLSGASSPLFLAVSCFFLFSASFALHSAVFVLFSGPSLRF